MSEAPSPSEEGKDPDVIYPDAIEVDDGQNFNKFDGEAAGQTSARSWVKNRNPLVLRLLCLAGFGCCLIFSLGVLLAIGLLGCIALLFLLRNRELNQLLFAYLKLLANTIVAAAGCLIGIVSPTIGFTLLLIYFSINDPRKLFSSIFKNRSSD